MLNFLRRGYFCSILNDIIDPLMRCMYQPVFVHDSVGMPGGGTGGDSAPDPTDTSTQANSSTNTSSTRLFYPESLDASGRPRIYFSCRASDAGSALVVFPCPTNIAYTDQANYNEASLNEVATAAASTARNLKDNLAGTEGNVGDFVQAISESDPVKKAIGALATQKVKDIAGGSDMVKGGMIGLGMAFNPNVTTEFTGMNTRRFEFTFKMMPISPTEAQTIHDIYKAFQVRAYPSKAFKGAGLNVLNILKYPPQWQIFYSADIGNRMPKIFNCYLDRVNLTINPTSPSWLKNSASQGGQSAAAEYDLGLSFVEFRALTYEDIQ